MLEKCENGEAYLGLCPAHDRAAGKKCGIR